MSEKLKVTYQNSYVNKLTFENGQTPIESDLEAEQVLLLNLLLSKSPQEIDQLIMHQVKSHEAQDLLWAYSGPNAELSDIVTGLQQAINEGLGWEQTPDQLPPIAIQQGIYTLPSGITSWIITQLSIDTSQVEFSHEPSNK